MDDAALNDQALELYAAGRAHELGLAFVPSSPQMQTLIDALRVRYLVEDPNDQTFDTIDCRQAPSWLRRQQDSHDATL